MRVKYIDVLKAFAIIAVFLYHAGVLTYGYLGVDLFLVIAGYLTTRSLNGKFLTPGGETSSSWNKYFNFEIGRVIRLLPLLLVAGAACMLAGYFVMLPDDYENLSESVVATNVFGNNILAAITTKNYWDVANEYKPLMHTWYVGVLMQFYLVYPLLFFISRLDRQNPRRTLLTMISTLAVISLLIYFGTTNTAARFYYLPSRFFEFAAGGIAALVYSPQEDRPFGKWFVYSCYALLLLIMALNVEILPAIIKLVLVVALSVVLLCSQDVLENRFTGNGVLAKVGAASYSIFVWHQVLLAFYRYTVTNTFSIGTYVVLLLAVAFFSWLSYQFIEQTTTKALKSKQGKIILYASTISLFILLTAFAGYIYLQGGVVRDVPELFITKGQKVNHKEYNNSIYKLDKPFETDKKHWLVVGNSTGRDFANVILESEISEQVEVTYIYTTDFAKPEYGTRFASADRVFLSSLGIDEELVTQMEVICSANGFDVKNLVIVGEKSFGESNGQFYIHRNKPYYFDQRTKMRRGIDEKNERLRNLYGDRFLDLISLTVDDHRTVPVFTPDHHYISQDCVHFSKGGAIYFSKLIDWNKYVE